MSFDLALAPTGDILFAGSGDLQGVSGTDLIAQRMLLRLKIQRGSWTYDEDESIGSQLSRVTGMTTRGGPQHVDAFVREALRDMDEIVIDAVNVTLDGTAVICIIDYHVTGDTISMTDENNQQLEVAISGGPA
jgi:hypothetical protein